MIWRSFARRAGRSCSRTSVAGRMQPGDAIRSRGTERRGERARALRGHRGAAAGRYTQRNPLLALSQEADRGYSRGDMTGAVFAGIETGGSRIRARIAHADGGVLADAHWPTTTPDAALTNLVPFLAGAVPASGTLAAIGIAAFGPVVRDARSGDYGRVLNTPKAGWSGSN